MLASLIECVFPHSLQYSYGRSSLHKAAEKGHLSCLDFLLARNADVDARDE